MAGALGGLKFAGVSAPRGARSISRGAERALPARARRGRFGTLSGFREKLTSCSGLAARLREPVTKTFFPVAAALGLLCAPAAAQAWGVMPPAFIKLPPAAPAAEPSGLDWARRTCDAIMKSRPVLTETWHYDTGLVLSGFESVWRKTGERRYLAFVKATIDGLVGADGTIKGYEPRSYILDDVNMGKVLFALLRRRRGRRRQGALPQGALRAARAAGEPAPHRGGRVLAQADLPAADLGRRHLHGVAVSRQVRGRVRRARRARRGGQAGAARGEAAARREDRPPLSRLGREQEGALGESRDRVVVPVLGARGRLVRDGRRRRARRDAQEPPAAGRGRRRPPAARARDRGRARQGDRRLVAGAGRGRSPAQLPGGLGIGDVRLRAHEG